MIADTLLYIALASLLATSLAAIAARSLRHFSRHDLELISQKHEQPERFIAIVRNDDRVALGVEIMAVLCGILATSAGSIWAWQHAASSAMPWLALILIVLALGAIATLCVVWLPWSIARLAAAEFLFRTWPFWNLVSSLAAPLVWGALGIDYLLHRALGRAIEEPDEESLEEEIRTIVSEGHREGLLEEEAREMIEGVIELGDAVVSHIMTPRTEIGMIQVDKPWDEIVETIIDYGHTRVPMYDKTRDDIAGILYIKDLLPELAKAADDPHRSVRELLRKPLFVPETKPVDDLLQLFQKTRTHIAVVLDEFGGVSGLVTIEDVLEEIVGEIDDEYDQKSEEEIRKIDDDVCEAVGRAHIDEINSLMGFELPEDEDFDTIGGFVFAEFGRVPAAGETITWRDSVRVIVLEASRRRVTRVRLERIRKESLEAV